MLEIFLLIIIAILLIFTIFLFKKASSLEEDLSHLNFKKNSQSIKYGKISEQFLPFSESFPYEKENFRFIGSPIDGLSFNDDEIVFCEFKTADSKLSKKQKHIKELVKNKKILWKEFNLRQN